MGSKGSDAMLTRKELCAFFEKTVLLDGATGSNLQKAGMPRGCCTEEWILANPDKLVALQREYVAAGSNILYAPTFQAQPIALEKAGLQKQTEAINAHLVALSKSVSPDVLVAGNLTTLATFCDSYDPEKYDLLVENYRVQIGGLLEGGADLLAAETLMSVDEATAAVDAAQSVCDLPIMCTLTVAADGNALYGGSAVEAVTTLQEMGAAAAGINCSCGPDQLEAVVRCMCQVAKIPVIVKPNAGMPQINERGEAIYDMGAADFARHMKKLAALGATVLGGCCGTTPEYIRALAAAVR